MAQEPLDRVQIGPALEQVGREGVAQRVDAASLLYRRVALGSFVDALRAADRDRLGAPLRREEPQLRPGVTPVGPHLLQQPWREQRVAILPALALLDPNRHAIGVEIAHAQVHELAHPKPGPVGGHQQHPVFPVLWAREDAGHLLPGEDLRQLCGGLRARDGEVHLLAAERRVIEETQAVGDEAARIPRELALRSGDRR